MLRRQLVERGKGAVRAVKSPAPSALTRKATSLAQGKPSPSGSRPAGGAIELVHSSPLFDHEWYALQTGFRHDRREAARHYVRKGRQQGLTPHPLFQPEHVAKQMKGATPKDAFLKYLRRRTREGLQTHPLFDTKEYLKANPAARRHRYGALGHYVEFGATRAASPNDWYQASPSAQPEGLAGWIRAHGQEWVSRRVTSSQTWSSSYKARLAREFKTKYETTAPHEDPRTGLPLVSVIVPAGLRFGILKQTLTSVVEQTLTSWEVIVLDSGEIEDLESRLDTLSIDRLRVISVEGRDASAMNSASAIATGEFITWISPGEIWHHDRLRLLVAVCQIEAVDGAYDILMNVGERDQKTYTTAPYSQARFNGGARLLLSQLMLRRDSADAVGPFDATLLNAWDFDYAYRAFRSLQLQSVPVRGAKRVASRFETAERLSPSRRPNPYHAAVDSWHDVVVNRYAIDWEALQRTDRDAETISVVIPTFEDWRMTAAAVQAIGLAGTPAGHRIEIVIYDNGSSISTAIMLDSLQERFDSVKVVHSPANHGFALGNNLAMSSTRGALIVFLNNDTEVQAGWLEPLIAKLHDKAVLGAQSLLLYPTGTIQSAGVAFPRTGGIPHAFLQGFPSEDASCLDDLKLHALTGAALALRFDDVVALRGFDPVFRNGMEDVDLCLRLAATRPGYFVTVPASRVIHHESRSHGRFTQSLGNRSLYIDRWHKTAPRDDHALWAATGLRVMGHEVRQAIDSDLRVCIPEPVLVKQARLSVTEGIPRLRWAIKNPAPAGPLSESWGDTHFARRLAAALRELGQDVVIDHRPEFSRNTGRFDDVTLVLRGLAPYNVRFGQVNLAWLISHPEMLGEAEAASYDRVLAASEPWAAKMSKSWGIRIDPLLQATDPELFNPDLATPDTGHAALFIGGSRKVHRTIVKQAISAGLPLSIYGSEWEPFIPSEYVKGQYVDNQAIGAMYRAAGVVLNDHWETMRTEGFISNRLFDAAGAGARVITDDVSGLEGIFGRSVQVARNTAEILYLTSSNNLDEIFGDDSERRTVAARVHQEHSFRARAQTLIETALDVRAHQPEAAPEV